MAEEHRPDHDKQSGDRQGYHGNNRSESRDRRPENGRYGSTSGNHGHNRGPRPSAGAHGERPKDSYPRMGGNKPPYRGENSTHGGNGYPDRRPFTQERGERAPFGDKEQAQTRSSFGMAVKQASAVLKDPAQKAEWERRYSSYRKHYRSSSSARYYSTLRGFIIATLNAELKGE